MKGFRFSISGLMAAVLVAALDVGACKALLSERVLDPDLSDLVVFGGLPMANVLALGLVPLSGSRHRGAGRRRALIGFEAAGLAALACFLGCSALATGWLHDAIGDVLRTLGLHPGLVFVSGAVVLLLVPQVAFALLGGWLAGKLRNRNGEDAPASASRDPRTATRRQA